MDPALNCPSCGRATRAAAAEGLCPSCLLQAALGEPEPPPGLEAVPAGKIFGDYQVLGPLGEGGMGVVYAARQISLNRPVALKMVRAPHLASDGELARFRQEAEAAARLDHPNIVPVYEAGERDGVQYFTMKLVDGARSLASDLAAGPADPREAARLLLKVARAVHYAHQRGVIHRDIKPANILLDREGEPQLADFGLAKLQEAAISLTHADRMIGTPQYMSPEQVRGQSREITTATDIYSLGAVLYEMLTGRPPFHSRSVHEILRLVAEKEPKPPRQLNRLIEPDLQTICLKCLEKNPAQRYASASDLANDLEAWLSVRPITARPVTAMERLRKWGRRNPVVAGLGAALLVVAILAVASLIILLQRQVVAALKQVVSTASALRGSHKAGRYWEAMALVEEATRMMTHPLLPKKDAMEVSGSLRNELIACLSLVDVRPADFWKRSSESALGPDFDVYAEASADGRIVVSWRSDPRKTASVATGRVLPGSLRFSADGKIIAAIHTAQGGGPRLGLWAVPSSKVLLDLPLPHGGVFDVSPDGTRLALVSDSQLRLVPVGGGAEPPPLSLAAAVEMVRFSPDGRRVAVARREDHVWVIDAATSAVTACREDSLPHCVTWDPSGRWLAIGGLGHVFIWDTLHGDADRPVRYWEAHNNGVVENLAWHPGGHLLASESNETIALWNVRTGSPEVNLSGQSENGLNFSPDGRRMGLIRRGENLELLEVNPGSFGRYAVGHRSPNVSGADWSPGAGRVLATVADDGVRFWNRDGESIGQIKVDEARSVLWDADALIVTGHRGIMRWPIVAADDGTRPAIGLGRMEMIDARPGWERAAMSPPDAAGSGRWLAVTHPDRTLLMKPDGSARVVLEGQRGAAYVAFSRDNRWLATGSGISDERSVHVWSIPDGKSLAVLPVRGPSNVGFTIDGELRDRSDWLVIGNAVRYDFWRTGEWTKSEFFVRTQQGSSCGPMAFSSRGTALALESERHQIKIVYPHPPLLRDLAAPDFDRQSPLSFSPRGGLLVDVDEKSHIILWDLVRLRQDLVKFGLDWRGFPEIHDPALPLVLTVTVEGAP